MNYRKTMEMKSGIVKVSRTRPRKTDEWARSGHKSAVRALRRLVFLKRQVKERGGVYRRVG